MSFSFFFFLNEIFGNRKRLACLVSPLHLTHLFAAAEEQALNGWSLNK